MMFMNEWEIENAVRHYREHPVLGPATRTLENLMVATNQNSDGWAYWPKPCRAAAKLQTLIQCNPGSGYRYYDDAREDATVAKLKEAYRPLKSFRTRSGLDFEIEEVS